VLATLSREGGGGKYLAELALILKRKKEGRSLQQGEGRSKGSLKVPPEEFRFVIAVRQSTSCRTSS